MISPLYPLDPTYSRRSLDFYIMATTDLASPSSYLKPKKGTEAEAGVISLPGGALLLTRVLSCSRNVLA
jgi:hypothetical protein